jgi:hypothetical protein
MAGDLDGIVGRHPRPLPFHVRVGCRRQRLEGRLIELLQQRGAAFADMPHNLGIDRRHALADRGVRSASEKNVRLRSFASTKRSTICPATSTLALLRGCRTRAGGATQP